MLCGLPRVTALLQPPKYINVNQLKQYDWDNRCRCFYSGRNPSCCSVIQYFEMWEHMPIKGSAHHSHQHSTAQPRLRSWSTQQLFLHSSSSRRLPTSTSDPDRNWTPLSAAVTSTRSLFATSVTRTTSASRTSAGSIVVAARSSRFATGATSRRRSLFATSVTRTTSASHTSAGNIAVAARSNRFITDATITELADSSGDSMLRSWTPCWCFWKLECDSARYSNFSHRK